MTPVQIMQQLIWLLFIICGMTIIGISLNNLANISLCNMHELRMREILGY